MKYTKAPVKIFLAVCKLHVKVSISITTSLFAFMITQTSSHQNKLDCNYFISNCGSSQFDNEHVLSCESISDWILKETCRRYVDIMKRFGPNMNLSWHNMINQQGALSRVDGWPPIARWPMPIWWKGHLPTFHNQT